MKVVLATDHAGFLLKEELKTFVQTLGFDVEDFGAYSLDETDDYPDFVEVAAQAVSNSPEEILGIVIGGSGQGEAMLANRFPNVRAVVFNGQYDPKDGRDVPEEIIISREHNNSNILSLGARFLNIDEAKDAVKTWLKTSFRGEERHVRRIEKIEKITKKLHS